jgi:hypothetical protein
MIKQWSSIFQARNNKFKTGISFQDCVTLKCIIQVRNQIAKAQTDAQVQ